MIVGGFITVVSVLKIMLSGLIVTELNNLGVEERVAVDK